MRMGEIHTGYQGPTQEEVDDIEQFCTNLKEYEQAAIAKHAAWLEKQGMLKHDKLLTGLDGRIVESNMCSPACPVCHHLRNTGTDKVKL